MAVSFAGMKLTLPVRKLERQARKPSHCGSKKQ